EADVGLSRVFGIEPKVKVTVQKGRYHIRGALNGMKYIDMIGATQGVLGVQVSLVPAGGQVTARFSNGAPAVVAHSLGKGKSIYTGACPAIAYAKEAKFVPRELKEKWPAAQRGFINGLARQTVPRLVESSHPVVEAGVYDSERGTAVILANFTYEPIEDLEITLRLPKAVKSVRSVEKGPLRFSVSDGKVTTSLELGLNDIILFE
ncbi:hypothetical protein HQ560_08970, partial [bacterium]|nr:hypothetical protein [bacterium]